MSKAWKWKQIKYKINSNTNAKFWKLNDNKNEFRRRKQPYHLERCESKKLVIYDPSVGEWSNLNWRDKNFEPTSQSEEFCFDPPNAENKNILTPFKRNLQYWIISKATLSTPLIRNVLFFHPPSSRSSKTVDPLICRPSLYYWVKNDQPLTRLHWFFYRKYWYPLWC